ncbi:hypothetical protein ACWKTS_30510 [Bacillus toyonensis]|uniref:hypothetical protein n=1 Tax=Bacillus cereus group TaxID=86661 RepID=UPI001593FD74|nr:MULTISPECIES: hypothetical protein [Bacillus cereus group]
MKKILGTYKYFIVFLLLLQFICVSESTSTTQIAEGTKHKTNFMMISDPGGSG